MAHISRSVMVSFRSLSSRVLGAAEGRAVSSTSRNSFSLNGNPRVEIGSDTPVFRRRSFSSSRIPVELGCAESLLPLHSAVASARLTSRLAINPRSLSQEIGLSVPR